MPRKESIPAASSSTAQAQQEAISDGIENYELPKTLVTRIAKSAIPEQAKLQKETVTALLKGSTVFINYLAATAHDIASSRQHKTISASDVLKALEMIQFGDMVEPLQQELQVFRENAKSAKKGSKAGAASTATATNGSARSTAQKGTTSTTTTKGKGRAGAGPSPLSTSVSASGAGQTNETGDGDGDEVVMGEAQDGDENDEEEPEPGEGEEEDELADDVDVEEDGDEDEDEDSGEGEGEGEELEDRMAVEEDELKQDERRANIGEGSRDGE